MLFKNIIRKHKIILLFYSSDTRRNDHDTEFIINNICIDIPLAIYTKFSIITQKVVYILSTLFHIFSLDHFSVLSVLWFLFPVTATVDDLFGDADDISSDEEDKEKKDEEDDETAGSSQVKKKEFCDFSFSFEIFCGGLKKLCSPFNEFSITCKRKNLKVGRKYCVICVAKQIRKCYVIKRRWQALSKF